MQAAELAAVGIDDDEWVFTDGDGQPIHPHALSQVFERTARRAGVPVITTFATPTGPCSFRAGVPVKVMSERLGHSTRFTLQQYAHVIPGMQAEAAEAIARIIADEGGSPGTTR